MNKPKTLQELAQLVIDHQDASARQIAVKADELGLKLTYTTLNQMRNGTYKSDPREDTLRALAHLAGVSDEVAFTAAGKRVPGPPLADELPPGSDNLSPRSRKVVVDMLRVLIDLEDTEHELEQRDDNDPPTPLRSVSDDNHSEDAGVEQKIQHAAFKEGLGPGIGPDDTYEDS